MDSTYCKYVKALELFSPNLLETHSTQIKQLFSHVNEQIRGYHEQYQVLLAELGDLCPTNASKETKAEAFFMNLRDYLQLGLSTYPSTSQEWKTFDKVRELLEMFLKGSIRNFEQAEPLSKALLLQLTKLSWALTNASGSMQQYAKHIGGTRKTRKQKRT